MHPQGFSEARQLCGHLGLASWPQDSEGMSSAVGASLSMASVTAAPRS